MSDDTNKSASTAAVELVKLTYQDGLQPTVKELAKPALTTAKLVTAAFAPIRFLVWGAERLENFFVSKVAPKLEGVAAEKIVTPPANVAIPLLQAAQLCEHADRLQEMFAHLLATAMNADTRDDAHPAFVDVVKQFSQVEALILALTEYGSVYAVVHPHVEVEGGVVKAGPAHCSLSAGENAEDPETVEAAIDNMVRLGVMRWAGPHTDRERYEQIVKSIDRKTLYAAADLPQEGALAFRLDGYELTAFGKRLRTACGGFEALGFGSLSPDGSEVQEVVQPGGGSRST